MKGALAIALHELRLTLADRSAVLWMAVLPLVFAAVIGLAIRGGGGPAEAAIGLAVSDEDGGPLAALFVRELEREGVSVTRVAPGEPRPEAPRWLTIPARFGARAIAGEQVVLPLESAPESAPDADLVARARIVAAIARVIGTIAVESARLEGGVPASEEFAAAPVPDDLVTVEARFAGKARVVPSGFAQSAPGNAVMFVMLVALTYGASSLASERGGGQLKRMLSAPVTPLAVVAGKLLGRLLVALVQILVFVGAGVVAVLVFGLPLGGNPFAVFVVLAAYAFAVAPLGVLLGTFFRDPDRAANVGVLATMVMAALGGCWWPIEITSATLQKVALALPTGWAMRGLHDVISFGRGFEALGLPVLVLVATGGVLSWLAARSLRAVN